VVARVFAWVLLVVSGSIAALMIVVGMFEELPQLIRDESRRTTSHH
jgi:hypothetical protein